MCAQLSIEFPQQIHKLLCKNRREQFWRIVGVDQWDFVHIMHGVALYGDNPSMGGDWKISNYCRQVRSLADYLNKYAPAVALKIAHNLLCNRHDLVPVFYLGMETEADIQACQTYEFCI